MSDPLDIPHQIALAMNAKEELVATIRVESCRVDRCPACRTGTVGRTVSLLCGCLVCDSSCARAHLTDLLTEALRQLSEQRHPCPCGKDTASIKWARCYSCRQQEAEERERMAEERDVAIRKGAAERAMLDEILALPDVEAPSGDGSENVASAVANALEALREERDAAIRERDRARKVSEQYECDFTAAKYEFGVTLTAERERAENAEAVLRECERFIAEHSTTWRSGRRLRDAMLARIREALPK